MTDRKRKAMRDGGPCGCVSRLAGTVRDRQSHVNGRDRDDALLALWGKSHGSGAQKMLCGSATGTTEECGEWIGMSPHVRRRGWINVAGCKHGRQGEGKGRPRSRTRTVTTILTNCHSKVHAAATTVECTSDDVNKPLHPVASAVRPSASAVMMSAVLREEEKGTADGVDDGKPSEGTCR